MVCAFLWIFLLTQLGVSTARSGRTCTFNGQSYEVGELWHPTLEPFIPHSKPCINCTCQENGNVNCTSEKCPRPDCEVPIRVRGKCCATCDLQENGGKGMSTPSPGCNFNGEVYEDGAQFTSERTGVTPTREDQCVMCVCSTGKVLCHLKTCEHHGKCKTYTNVSDDCCPQCDEEPDYADYLDLILSGERPVNHSKTDCVTATGTKKNGDTWHPMISIYGPNKCILCQCQERRVTCERKKCGAVEKLRCQHPVQLDGECCQTCPKTKTQRKRKCKKRRGKDGKKRRRCKKNGGRHGKKTRTKSTSAPKKDITAMPHPATKPPPSLFSTMCLPKRVDRYVYQLEDRHSVVLIFDIPSDETVEVMKWNVRRGRLSEMIKENRKASELRSTIQHSHILGATNKRNFKKFKRKLRKKLQRCKTSCRRKVITGCLKRLKIKNVKFGKHCDRN